MKAFKGVLLAALLLPAFIAILSLFLPSKYRVESSIETHATAEVIFAQVNVLAQWTNWTAWPAGNFPPSRLSFSGPESGPGATYAWDSEHTGRGVLKLTRAEPDKGIGYQLEFDHGKNVSKGAIEYVAAGDGMKVTWSNEGDLGWNPISRIFGLLMDTMIRPHFEQGLRNLKQKAEAN